MKWDVWMISGSFSDSLNYVVLNPNPTIHSLETLEVYVSLIILSQYFFFSVELTSNFAEKAEKGTCHWVLHWKQIIQQKSCEDEKQVHGCMHVRMALSVSGAVVSHCSSTQWGEVKQYVTNVLVTSFLNEQATVHGKHLQKHCMSVPGNAQF